MGPAEEDVLWQQLEEQFPVWNQAEMDGIKPEDSEEIYEDKFGLIMPKYLSNYIDCWKRPSQLVVKNPDVPMIVFDENENDVASRKVKGEMFAGNDRGFEWLVAVMMAIKDRTKVIQANDKSECEQVELDSPEELEMNFPCFSGLWRTFSDQLTGSDEPVSDQL